MHGLWILLMCLLAAPRGSLQSMVCYSCEYHAGEVHEECIKDPESVTTSPPRVNCNKKFCTIIRQEHVNTGKINSFRRGCDDSLAKENGVHIDSYFKTYYTSCTTDVCNYGIGINTNGGGDNGGGGFYMPGTGGASGVYAQGAVIMIPILTALFKYWM